MKKILSLPFILLMIMSLLMVGCQSETIISPLPIFLNSFPFQPLPCMWSLHKSNNKEEDLLYYNFYDFSGNDPRKDFIIKLIDTLGDSGDILIYSDYEIRILKKIISSYPEMKNNIENSKEKKL